MFTIYIDGYAYKLDVKALKLDAGDTWRVALFIRDFLRRNWPELEILMTDKNNTLIPDDWGA